MRTELIYALLAFSILAAALIGRAASRPGRRRRALCGIALVVLLASIVLMGLAGSPVAISRVVFTATLVLVVGVMTLPTFGVAWIASGPSWSRQAWIWLSAIIGLGSLFAFPIYAIYASCYILGDCP